MDKSISRGGDFRGNGKYKEMERDRRDVEKQKGEKRSPNEKKKD